MMIRDAEENLLDLGQCSHKPLRPPRPGHIGEQVFADCWEKLMATPAWTWYEKQANHQLTMILHHMPNVLTQRHATVAATLIKWLGTNCGSAFLHDARQLEQSTGRFYERAYLAAWALENVRSRGVSGGYRAIEHLLAPDDHFGEARDGCSLRKQPDLSVEDYEVMEHVVIWLGSTEGKLFTAACEREIEHLKKVKWREDMAKSNPDMLARLDAIEAAR